ncbi:hypothetical protein FACS1894202_05880 [Clostridia bacterium]|nr:hypothetical protein FACS1894202_05880 [Clostridia bacterium]
MKRVIMFLLILSIFSAEAAAAETAPPVELPVLMYHRLLKNNPQGDEYTITPDALERDLNYLQAENYTSVTTDQVIGYLSRGEELPDKPILLTFDDGHYSTLSYAAPLLERYGFCASVFVTGKFSDSETGTEPTPLYSYISWEQMQHLPSCLQIENHTWDLHLCGRGRNGIQRKKSESLADYRMRLASDLLTLQGKVAENARRVPVAFALPFGASCKDAVPVFDAVGIPLSFGSYSGINRLTVGGERHELKRLCRVPRKSAQFLLDKYANK